jgi:flavin reductase (DIM6/NTAB) family NADH-FMN oxidoreductase RutF
MDQRTRRENMTLEKINPLDLQVKPHQLFLRQAMLLTAGDFASGDFNCMTIGWGSIGTMWNKPFVLVAVRPTRHTFLFMEKYPDFTVTAFPNEYADDLLYLGRASGRDGNKLAKTKLTAIASHEIASPTFAQAELSFECKKIFFHDFLPEKFVDTVIEKHYPLKDYHRVYYGEIVAAFGISAYNSQV